MAGCLEPVFRLEWIRATVEGHGKVEEARAWLQEEVLELQDAADAEGERADVDPDEPTETTQEQANSFRQLFR